MREYFRPNCWPNTPDILPEYLQYGGRPAFIARLVLAATLGASYGIYGPAFELLEHAPREPGSEEYLDSEKYEMRAWDLDAPDSLARLIARLNSIRRDHPALQQRRQPALPRRSTTSAASATARRPTTGRTSILVVVNLDPHIRSRAGSTSTSRRSASAATSRFQVHDLLSDARYLWHGARNYVELDPHVLPAHVFRVRRACAPSATSSTSRA